MDDEIIIIITPPRAPNGGQTEAIVYRFPATPEGFAQAQTTLAKYQANA
jgi:hypothetical protein